MPEKGGMLKGLDNHIRGKLLTILIVSTFLIGLIMTLLVIPTHSENNSPGSNIPARITYALHDPISIIGTAQFNNTNYPFNGVVSGNGSSSNPYIIEGWNIDASATDGIYISSMGVHFIVRDCYIHGGGLNYCGIYLDLCTNGTLSNNTCSSNDYGIYLYRSNYIIVSNNTCEANLEYGIYMDFAFGTIVYWNQFLNNGGEGVYIYHFGGGWIWNNTFVDNNGAGSTYNASHIQACDSFFPGQVNSWNISGTPHGYGNYWSDWTTPDHNGDGIVDLSYIIPGGAGPRSYYPLTYSPTDHTAPVTNSSISGTSGSNGWYTTTVSISLSATDAGYSGVNKSFYRIGTSGNWLTYSSAFDLTNEGNSTVQFFSMDNASNNESIKNIALKIDKTGPILTINQTAGFETVVNYAVISWNGSDATSGIDHFEVSIGGGSSTSVGNAMSHNFSGLADGAHTVTVKAIDAAGNVNSKSIQFTVKTSASGTGPSGTSGDLMFYAAIVVIIVVIIAVAIAIMMRKKKKP